MIVCSCNVLSCAQIRGAARNNPSSPAAVYRALGCRPRCGTCLPRVGDLLEEVRRELVADISPFALSVGAAAHGAFDLRCGDACATPCETCPGDDHGDPRPTASAGAVHDTVRR